MKNRSIRYLPLTMRGACEPTSIFRNMISMKRSLERCLDDHILPRHKYMSTNDKKRYQTRHGKDEMSIFDDFWGKDEIRHHVLETLKHPTYVVRMLQYFDRNILRPKYLVEKW